MEEHLTIEAESDLRQRVGYLGVAWRAERGAAFAGESHEDFAAMLNASHVIAEEARLSLQRWADAARRAGMSWSDIGHAIGISKQAAQQRFGHAEPIQLAWIDRDVIIRNKVVSVSEMTTLEAEGAEGRELIGVGVLQLKFRQTSSQWEYRRVVALSAQAAMAAIDGDGWSHVAGWFPFHYLKRSIAVEARQAA